MDIELRLREIMTAEDPGVQVTDAVMSRVGGQDVPGHSGARVYSISQGRARRSRLVLVGAFVTVAAAAGMLVQHGGWASKVTLSAEPHRSVTVAAHETVAAPASASAVTVGETAGLNGADTASTEIRSLPVTRSASTVPASQASAEPARSQQMTINWSSLNEIYPNFQEVMGFTLADAEAFYRLLSANTSAAEMERLIGREKADRWKEYLKSIEARRRVGSLASSLKYSSHPLTGEQASVLLPMVDAELQSWKSSVNERPKPDPNDYLAKLEFDELTLKHLEESYNRVVESARYMLDGEQIPVLQSKMDADLNSIRTSLRSKRAQIEAGTSPPSKAVDHPHAVPSAL